MNLQISLVTAVLTISVPLVFSLQAEASQVQSALNPNAIGISAQQLFSSSGNLTFAVPDSNNRPPTMNTNAPGPHFYAGVHLGTNTDLFADLFNLTTFWVRYTLDSSSNEFHQSPSFGLDPVHTSTSAITGSLWLSFNLSTQSFNAYDELINRANLFSGSTSFAPFTNLPAVNALYSGGPGYVGQPSYEPYPATNANLYLVQACIECSHETSLNLAFLELRWNGSGYGLYTSSQGFDQIVSFKEEFYPYQEINTYALNIAPVPVPAAGWLFGSGAIAIAAARRRQAKPV